MNDILQSILILVGVLAIVSIPLLLLYFLSNRDWRFNKLSANQLKEEKIRSRGGWRLFGFILILASAGASFGIFSTIAPDITTLPLYVKILIFLFGVALVLAANYDEKKLRQKPKTDFIVSKNGDVSAAGVRDQP